MLGPIVALWRHPNLRATQCLAKGVVPLLGDGFLFYTAGKTLFFMFSIVSINDWTNFWPLRKLKKSHVQSSRIFIRKKDVFGSCLWNGSTGNFEMILFGYPIKNLAFLDSSGFVAVMFSLREIPHRPSSPSSSHLKNNLCFGIHMRFLWHRTG